MALSKEELLLQMELLTSKIEDNPDMVYKKNAILNKGLNPAHFEGQYTKIVNALNKLADDATKSSKSISDFMDKTNNLMLDISNEDNRRTFEHVQQLMGAPTIIEGLQNILEGNTQEQVLDLKEDDFGKFLTVGKSKDNKLVVEAIDLILVAKDINYTNESVPEVSNVKEVLDYIVEEVQSPVQWDEIENVPMMEDSDVEDIIDNLNM